MARVTLRARTPRPYSPGRVYGDPGPVPWSAARAASTRAEPSGPAHGRGRTRLIPPVHPARRTEALPDRRRPRRRLQRAVADPAVAAEAWAAWGEEITFTERAAAAVFGRMPCPGRLGSEPVTFLEFSAATGSRERTRSRDAGGKPGSLRCHRAGARRSPRTIARSRRGSVPR
jgi:hypothetical protein